MIPVEFLHYADQIAQTAGLGPAEYRSAISRAYYAAYHSGRAFLRAAKIEAPDNHGAVWGALLCGGDLEIVKAGSDLGSLHGDRRKADYQLANRACETQGAAGLAVTKAAAIMGKLTTCLANPQRLAAVEKNIKVWVGKIPGGGGYRLLP
jgi:hypothetical protein